MSGRDREQTPGPGADDRGPQEAAAAPGPDASPKTPFLKRISALFSGPQPAANLADAIENGGDHAVAALPQGRREMIERVIAFDEKRVVDVMAPRADIIAIDVSTPMDELLKAFAEAGHSRLPVYRGDLDDPIGMAHIKDVVALLADPAAPGDSESNCNADNDVDAGGESDSDSAEPILRRIKRDVLYAPPSMPITDLLLRMQASRIHMALVIDEFGGTDGLVTIEDLVEEIVGDINDEHDDEDAPTVVACETGGWEADARVELNDFTTSTGVDVQCQDSEDEVDTLGGLVFSLAGRVPQRGEIISHDCGLDFEVTEADPRKIRKIRIRRRTGHGSAPRERSAASAPPPSVEAAE